MRARVSESQSGSFRVPSILSRACSTTVLSLWLESHMARILAKENHPGLPPPREREGRTWAGERGAVMCVVHSGERRGTTVGFHISSYSQIPRSFLPFHTHSFPFRNLAIVAFRALRPLIQCCPKVTSARQLPHYLSANYRPEFHDFQFDCS